jgi:hypothetical protein
MENSSETIGNRTRELPACSAVPQKNCVTAKTLSQNSYTVNINMPLNFTLIARLVWIDARLENSTLHLI